MKNRLILTGALAGLALLASAFARPETDAAELTSRASTVRVQDDDDDTQLAQYMKEINRGLRSLRSSLQDAERTADSLQTVRAIAGLVVKARGETPHLAASVPEADRPEFLKAYALQMIEFSRKLLDLEAALIQGDAEAAQAAYTAIGELKKPSHERFKG
ncbi:MAG: hypothetical protein IPM29_02285 [Planctomycetes bacterium]|nr:hypothetical protein [Planctomycetota bacterium]